MRKCESYAEFLGCTNARQIITNSLLLRKYDAIDIGMTIVPCYNWKHGVVRIYAWLMEQIAFDLWNNYPPGHTGLASRIYLLYIFRTSNANITRKQAFTFSTTVWCIGVYNFQWYGSRMHVIYVTKWSWIWSEMANTLSPVFLTRWCNIHGWGLTLPKFMFPLNLPINVSTWFFYELSYFYWSITV